jgi:peptidoglycan/xylan/chitin deacetylase (PgdA/CDA1 family)
MVGKDKNNFDFIGGIFIKRVLLGSWLFFLLGIYFIYSTTIDAKTLDQRQIPVLMYHNVLSDTENKRMRNSNIITEVEFTKQMDYLRQNGFHTLTLQDLERFLYDKCSLPEKPVVLTFDDGYLGNLTFAYPVLKGYHMKAAIAVMPHLLQAENRKVPKEVQTFSLRQFGGKEDVFSLVSHTDELHDKKNGIALIKVLPEETVYQDIRNSKLFLRTDYLVYPYGAYNERAIRIVKRAGYKMAFGMNEGYVHQGDNPYRLKRIYVYRGMPLSEFVRKVNGRMN